MPLVTGSARTTMGNCHTCGAMVDRKARTGLKLFCNRVCFGLSRRKAKTKTQKVEEKRLYDMARREKLRDRLKVEKAAYFQRTYDPVRAAKKRKERMPYHVEYCRQPAYKEWKSNYDQQYRAKKFFGAFWESALLVQKVDEEVQTRMSKYEIGLLNGTLNKSQQRKREYEARCSTSLVRS